MRAEYPNQLDYSGSCRKLDSATTQTTNKKPKISHQGGVILENTAARAKMAQSWRMRHLAPRWRNPREYASSNQGGVILENTPIRSCKTTPVGFELTRGKPIGLAGRRLNRSAKVSLSVCRERVQTAASNGLSYLNVLKDSATGTRTRVARVRAEYPNQLDYSGR